MGNYTISAEATINVGAKVTFRARFVDEDRSILAAADLSSIRMEIFDLQDPGTAIVIASGSATGLAVATSAATGTLATGGGWTADGAGYNFSHAYDTSTFLKQGHTYWVVHKFTTASKGLIHLITMLKVRGLTQ